MAGQRTRLQEDARFRILRLLHENRELSQRDLAKAMGSSVGGIHYILSALIETGLVKLENFTAAEDKRHYAYILTPRRPARLSTRNDLLKLGMTGSTISPMRASEAAGGFRLAP